MAIADEDMKENIDYSHLLDSLNSNVSEEALSVEDVAWADSCINNDVDSSNADWSSLKDVLLEILIAQSGPPISAAAESSGQPTDDEIHRSRENVWSLNFGRGSEQDEDLIDDDNGEAESIDISDEEEDPIFCKRYGRVKGKRQVTNVFRPNYTEETAAMEKPDSSLDLGLTTFEVEPLSEDIFKVWDLNVSDEQDDFTKELDKAFSEIPPQVQSAAGDSASRKDFTNVSVDDLISGFGGLTLMQSAK